MHVQVEYGLSGTRSYIQHGAISIFDAALPGHVGGRQMAQADDVRIFRGRLFQTANVFFGNYEDVRRRFRIGVFEGKSVLIFVNFLGWNFTGDDAAEQAIFHGSPVWREFRFRIEDCRFWIARCEVSRPLDGGSVWDS